ncbi:MAG: metallophosphoesterase [Treponema sp.]|nr:metallophosphoesterase [Treponema sp.]
MKILCISDLIDPLVYSNNIRERFKDVDLILCAGDLPLDYLDFIISSLNKPLLFIFGNHHTNEMAFFKKQLNPYTQLPTEAQEFGCGAVHIGSKIVTEEGLIIAGLGGCIKYNKGPNQYTDFQIYMEIFRMLPALLFHRIFHGRYLDILLTHAPPRGIHDKQDRCHQGFAAFLWFMKTFRPKYLIHGHIHLYDLSDLRITQYKETTVINAYGHYILQYNEAEKNGR